MYTSSHLFIDGWLTIAGHNWPHCPHGSHGARRTWMIHLATSPAIGHLGVNHPVIDSCVALQF